MHNSIAYCTHGTLKCLCRECGGRGGCPHVKRKCDCKGCGGGAWCAHEKCKKYCSEHGGGNTMGENQISKIYKIFSLSLSLVWTIYENITHVVGMRL